ncbi:hypothetical protein PFICI_11813 [Pestalotiopsis fici W106-1]|uniref:chitinase n=1 Tax=Pestalotiopsis fici (strain W106-1 / CGMCC3.15140) TaxID=1229662 RepID=W3WU97_PESFW|nr:uncharacterized protein PFICI_11813 [Pestalotiopsis fici W106-1]ETS76426.1 hypothetical protein PFICI_11813 [Pestalotiopsis fici W106-1]
MYASQTATPRQNAAPGPRNQAKNVRSMSAAANQDSAVRPSTDLGCQSNCPQPPSTGLSNGNVTSIVIGYYESWAPYHQGNCPKRPPSWIKTDSISHLNVAFGYIQPETYEIAPDLSSDEIMDQIIHLKEDAPGLKIYISLGGWTYSDNDTDTQAVWGDLASTPIKRQKFISQLANFMLHFGFDGVDLDWEYPGAPDRGGKDRDVDNFVALVKDIRTYWDAQSMGWGLTFTAPTSYWYMRWFDIENLVKHVDWINLMTYDLHGSWDSPEDQIGSYVYAHTNLSEIQDALNLLWRNNVPANKVNLGLGFYGRSYTLEDPSCTLPGCAFSSGGRAGACTGESGILSYNEISQIADYKKVKPVRDDKAAAMYFAFDQDQWVSYDNAATIKEKVDFADKQGLLGLFIWALDLDNDNYDALAAVLDTRGGLGTFGPQNGKGPANDTKWQPSVGGCYLGECAKDPSCGGGYQSVGDKVRCDDENEHRWVCCPRGNAPDASTCEWKASLASWAGAASPPCTNHCDSDQVTIAKSKWFIEKENDQGDKKCSSGFAVYCCKAKTDAKESCGMMSDECISIGDDGKPKGDDPCSKVGRKFVTYSQDTCAEGSWRPWCCDDSFDKGSECKWQGPAGDEWPSEDCENARHCSSGQVLIGVSKKGGGSDCAHKYYAKPPANPNWGIGHPMMMERALCCPAGETTFEKKAPVPLAWLFPDKVPDSDVQNWDLEIEADASENEDPNENGFGWVIMTGPDKDITSLDKRDGSHWELFDCPDRETMDEGGRYTVRAVCSDDTEDSNCDRIFLGQVERTVVEMPPTCGIGRHAMAVSMEPAEEQGLPHYLVKRLVKRGSNLSQPPRVYDFVFDYDFSVLHGRSDSDVQIRVDYSDDPHYWSAFVNHDPNVPPVKRDNVRRSMEAEVERDFGGSWVRYTNHRYRKERRETPEHEMEHFNKRYHGGSAATWRNAMAILNNEEFEQEITSPVHHVKETFPFYLFNENLQCTLGGIPFDAYFTVWADLHVDIQTSAQLTLIGRLNDLSSFKESHVLFRNRGSVQAGLHMQALAQLRFSTGPLELFGAANFGAAFKVPGIVTIGPNLRVLGELTGTFTVHTQAHYELQVSDWDFTQRYPNDGNDVESGLTGGSHIGDSPGPGAQPGKNDTSFRADVAASGDLTLKITPLVEFGIRWDPKFKVVPTAVSLQLYTYATLYGRAGVGTDTAPYACYGAVCGVDLFAKLEGPYVFRYTHWD